MLSNAQRRPRTRIDRHLNLDHVQDLPLVPLSKIMWLRPENSVDRATVKRVPLIRIANHAVIPGDQRIDKHVWHQPDLKREVDRFKGERTRLSVVNQRSAVLSRVKHRERPSDLVRTRVVSASNLRSLLPVNISF